MKENSTVGISEFANTVGFVKIYCCLEVGVALVCFEWYSKSLVEITNINRRRYDTAVAILLIFILYCVINNISNVCLKESF